MCIVDRLKARIARAREDIGTSDPLESAPDDQEEAISRLVLTDAAPDDDRARGSSGAADGSVGADRRLFVRLASEAASEHTRLLQARAGMFGAWREPLLASSNVDAWLAFERRPAIRSRLAPHMLVVLQSTFEDSCGRPVAAHLTPLKVHAGSEARGIIAAVLRSIEMLSPQNGDTAWMRWKVETRLIHHTFWATRRIRERAIATALATTGDDSFQPGLFDRRAECRHLATAEERCALIQDGMRYVAMAERAAVIEERPTRAVLVLLP
jgi:hypothetical protein